METDEFVTKLHYPNATFQVGISCISKHRDCYYNYNIYRGGDIPYIPDIPLTLAGLDYNFGDDYQPYKGCYIIAITWWDTRDNANR